MTELPKSGRKYAITYIVARANIRGEVTLVPETLIKRFLNDDGSAVNLEDVATAIMAEGIMDAPRKMWIMPGAILAVKDITNEPSRPIVA